MSSPAQSDPPPSSTDAAANSGTSGAAASSSGELEKPDPLLIALQRVSAWHGISLNTADALSGLPLPNDRLTPALLLRAAERSGFRARLEKRSLRKISATILPAILILKENAAGVLEPDEDGEARFYRTDDLDPTNSYRLTAKSLKRHYSGYVVLLRPTHVEQRPESVLPAMEKEGGSATWFWATLWKFKRELLRLLPASALINLFALSMPLFIMSVYDRVVPNNAEDTLWVLAIGAATVFSFEYAMRLLRGYLLNRTGKRLDGVLASALFDHLMAMEMRARPLSSGLLASKARAYEALREFFTSASLVTLVDVPFALLMIAVIFYLAGPVGWIPLVAAVLALLFGLIMQVPMRRAVTEAYRGGLERQSFLTETVLGMETVKAGNAQGAFQRRMENMIREASEKEVRSHWYSLLGTSTTTWILHLTTIAVVIGSVYQVSLGEMTLGGVVAAVILTSRAMTPLTMVTGLMTRLQQTLASLRGLNQLMTLPREYGGGRQFTGRERVRPHFQLKDVTVRYPDQATPGLDEISLVIEPGDRVAVIGRVGSGKSTLLRVLAKLYEPNSGEVMLDGLELQQYHPVYLRSHIGYLPQDVTIFHGSLRDNIALGAPWMDDAQIIEAADKAGLSDFINHNPLGIHTPVGERGTRLSGGQREAIALARCLLRKPKLLLLDEPTANMDVNTEQEVMASLSNYLREDPERTLVLATHKLHLLDLANRVVVLDHGKIAADGDRDSVMKKLRQDKAVRKKLAPHIVQTEVPPREDGNTTGRSDG